MFMSRVRQRNLIRSILAGFILSVCILGVPWTSSASPALNPSGEPGVAPASPPVMNEPEHADMVFIARALRKLLKEGFVVDGPTEVVEVGTDSITLFTGKNRNWKVILSGKKVLIKDYAGNDILLSSIEPKRLIYTCRKDKDVVIFVMAKREARNDH
jgi:hypothetical protein